MGFTIKSRNKFGGVADSGYFLIPQFWGQGYASEALETILHFAFDKLKLHKMIAGCDSENQSIGKSHGEMWND